MSAELTLHLLGTPVIALDGQPVTTLPSRAAEALLIYVACTGRTHARDVVAELLWSEREPKQALANLRSILSSMRRKLKPFLHITRQTVAMNEESHYWLDVAEFEVQLRALDADPGAPTPLALETVSWLETTLELYRGDFLEGFYLRSGRGFEEWALLQRERLRRLAYAGLFRLVQHYLGAGHYAAGIRHAERLLAIDPLDERSRRAAMWLLGRNGQRNAALQQYETLRTLLDEELGVSPAAETRSVYERIRAAWDRPRHNLPPPTTPFVGRKRELQALSDKAANSGCRLLTILGPGGMGKTRLLLEWGRRTADNAPGRFLNGIRYVSLAHLDDAGLLPTTVAEALGLKLSSADPVQELLDYLREKELLLLLDNLEHLFGDGAGTDAVDLVATILEQAPLVKVVVTSRQRLHLQEEWVFDLGGLQAPPSGWGEQDRRNPAEATASFPAVDLFLQNARRVSHGFRPEAAERCAIAAICRRLDGLPLGIELAATWVREFTCDDILDRIEADLDFLITPVRNVPDRHRSLRALFEHSWQMLDEAEQAATMSLSVFRGAFSAAAAQQVAGASAQVLATLADKSFLHQVETEMGALYQLHELLRQYAGEHLATDPQRQREVRDAHACYCARFVRERTEALKGAGQRRAYREIGGIIDDIRAAWGWNLAEGRFRNVDQSLDGLFYFYWARGWLHEGVTVAERTAAAVSTLAPENRLLLARARICQGEFCGWLGKYEEGRSLLQGAIETFRALGARAELIFAVISLGRIYLWQGERAEAIDAFQESLMLARQAGDDHWTALALNSLAVAVSEAEVDYDRAWSLFAESLAVSRKIGDHFGVARALLNMGTVAQERAHYEEARRLYEKSLAIYREVAYGHGIAAALNYLGQIATLTGDYKQARELIRESLDRNRETGNRRAIADALKQLGNVAREDRDWAEAKRRYDEALRLAQEMGDDQVALAVLLDVCALLVQVGREAPALTLLAFILRQEQASRELQEATMDLLATTEALLDSTRAERCQKQGKGLNLGAAISLALQCAVPGSRGRIVDYKGKR